jgi:hypothetical protein
VGATVWPENISRSEPLHRTVLSPKDRARSAHRLKPSGAGRAQKVPAPPLPPLLLPLPPSSAPQARKFWVHRQIADQCMCCTGLRAEWVCICAEAYTFSNKSQ